MRASDTEGSAAFRPTADETRAARHVHPLRPLLTVAVVTGLVAGILWQGLLLTAAVRKLGYADFQSFLHTARALRSGEPAYPPTTRVSLNPPHFHLILLPVVDQPDSRALTWYLVLSAASGFWGLAQLWRTVAVSRVARAGLVGVVLLSCATSAASITLQVTWLLFGPLVAAWRAWRETRWSAGAAWFGLVLSVKPFLGVFLVWLLLRRRWSTAALTAASAGCAVLIGLLVFGWTPYADWWAALNRVSWTSVRLNASLPGLFERALTASPSGAAVADLPWMARLVTGVAIGLVSIFSIAAIRRARVDSAWAILVLAALLVSPLGWLYYAWWAAPGLIGMRWRPRNAAGWIAATILLWPQWNTQWGQPAPWATWTVASIYNWGLLTLWWAVVREAPAPESRRSAA